MMRPWYMPFSYGDAGGPVIVKCHSKRLDSRGCAVREGSGWRDSSLDSWRMRLMVGDFVLKAGRVVDMAGRAVIRSAARSEAGREVRAPAMVVG